MASGQGFISSIFATESSFDFDRRRIPGLGFKDLGLGFVNRRRGSTRREREDRKKKKKRGSDEDGCRKGGVQ
jgi:hypothetical protein